MSLLKPESKMLSKNQHFISILVVLVISLVIFGLASNYYNQHRVEDELQRRADWMDEVNSRLDEHELRFDYGI